MSKIYKAAIGLVIDIDCKTNISTATVYEMHVEKPSGTTATWTAGLHPTNNNYMRFTTTLATHLDEAGTYYINPYVEMPTPFEGSGDTTRLEVYEEYE